MKKGIIILLLLGFLFNTIYSESKSMHHLEKGDIIYRKLGGFAKNWDYHGAIYLDCGCYHPEEDRFHSIIEMSDIKTEKSNLERFKNTAAYVGARTYQREKLTCEKRREIIEMAQNPRLLYKYITNMPCPSITGINTIDKKLLIAGNLVYWHDGNNNSEIDINNEINEVIYIRSDGWVELVYACVGLQIQEQNILTNPRYFNATWEKQITDLISGEIPNWLLSTSITVTQLTPKTQFNALSPADGICPKFIVKDLDKNDIPNGCAIKDSSIYIDATDGDHGSGLSLLQIWVGDPEDTENSILDHEINEMYEEDHVYEITNLPGGEIYIRIYDQAGNYSTQSFVSGEDSDNDGLNDGDEDQNWNGIVDEGETDPNNPDSDGDSLSDGEEVNEYLTDPLNKDTDGDNYFDGTEVNILKSDPLNPLDPDPKEKAILFVNPSSLSIKKGKTATSKIWVENLFYATITGSFKTERKNDPNGIVLMSQPPASAVSYKNWKKYKWNEVPKYNLSCMNFSAKPGEHAIYSVKFTNIRFGLKGEIFNHKSNKDNENNSSDESNNQEKMVMFCGNNTDDPPDVPDDNDFFADDVDEPESTLLNLLTKTTNISYNDKNLIYGFDSNYGFCKAEILHDRDADIGVFFPGKFTANGKLLRKYLETINLLDIHTKEVIFFEDKKMSDHNLLILPTGSLMGIENDTELKYELEKYVEDGGVLVCFSQQHGYEFTVLPGGEVSGKGWREDQACHTYSVYVEEYHPVLSNLRNSVVNCNVDGYFTSYPDNSKILLRRTKNGYPAMILYPYGDGYVIASTLYTDWSYDKVTLLHEAPTLSREETNIYRDVISWSVKKNRENIPEFKQGDDVTFSVDILGTKYNMYASTAVIQIFNPDRDLQDVFTYPISLQEGNTVSIPINYNTNYPFGIWWVTYHLLNEDGIRITEEIRSNRFVLSNPPETYTPDENIQIWVTSPFETAFKGSEIPFEIHIKNNHNYDLVDYTLAIALWQLKESLIVTIPANSEITVNWTEPRFNAANMYWFGLYKPGVSYNYFCKNALVRTRRMVYESYPGADAEIQLSKEIILPNEDFDITVDIKNLNAVDYGAVIELRVLDSQNFPVYFEERDITLLSQQGLSEVFNVVLSSGINRGKCFVRADIIHDGTKIGGAIKGFDVPDLDLFFIPVFKDYFLTIV